MGPRAQLGRWRSRSADVGWRRLLLLSGLALVAVLVVVVGVRAWFSTRDATERTEADLQARRGELAQAQEDLAAAVAALDDARATLQDELDTLDLRQDERTAAQAALDAATAVLGQRRSELEASSTELQASTARLDALTRCVVGVSEALNQAAVGQHTGSAATLRGVADVCAAAGAVV